MKIDLHTHSYYSFDCFQPPGWVLKAASRRNLDAVAITDHNSFQGSKRALDLAEDFDVSVIGGMEVRTEEFGDLLALFISDSIDTRRFDAVMEEIREQNGLAVLPHPYRKYDGIPERVVERVDAIEGVNARSRPAENERARELGKDSASIMLGGSDAHAPWEVGRAHSVIEADDPVPTAEIRTAILSGEVGWAGDEMPYYVSHGVSYVTERVKSALPFNSRYMGGKR